MNHLGVKFKLNFKNTLRKKVRTVGQAHVLFSEEVIIFCPVGIYLSVILHILRKTYEQEEGLKPVFNLQHYYVGRSVETFCETSSY
jgi:hypothetical protein